MVHSLQLTFAVTGKLQLITGLPVPQMQDAAWLTIQCNGAAGNVRVGDSSVSATRGIILTPGAPGGAMTVQLSISRAYLPGYWLYAASGTVVDILYEDI